MNIIEKLRTAYPGTRLYSVIEGPVIFKEIKDNIIYVINHNHCVQEYHSSGRLVGVGMEGECVLFPSKDQRDWNKFYVFKKGDVVVSHTGHIAIIDRIADLGSQKNVVYYQGILFVDGHLQINVDYAIGTINDVHLATKEQRMKFFSRVFGAGYRLTPGGSIIRKSFDPQTFEPYQKVLVRSFPTGNWRCTFFSHMTNGIAICSGGKWPYCIPYENNKHLRGKTDDCDDFYKWWKD